MRAFSVQEESRELSGLLRLLTSDPGMAVPENPLQVLKYAKSRLQVRQRVFDLKVE